jgi:hypothetical protein
MYQIQQVTPSHLFSALSSQHQLSTPAHVSQLPWKYLRALQCAQLIQFYSQIPLGEGNVVEMLDVQQVG